MSENLKGEIINGVLYIEQDGEIKEIETPIEKAEPGIYNFYTVNEQDPENPNSVYFYTIKSPDNKMPVIREIDLRTYAPEEVVDLLMKDPEFEEYFNNFIINSGYTKIEVVGKLPEDTEYQDGVMYAKVSEVN